MKLSRSILLLTTVLTLAGQRAYAADRSFNCDDENRRWDHDRQERFCEIREYTTPARPRVMVDGRTNGGIAIKGWDQREMLVRAKVETWAPSAGEARSIASHVQVITAGGEIRADGLEAGRDRGWGVSYEVFVPHNTGLSLKAHNGGIGVSDVVGDISFDAVNGGVTLERLGGTVRGKTTNGGIRIELAGSKWEGNELNVSTVNGGVSMAVPEQYSARLETQTVNGRVSVDFPITVQGNIDKDLSFTLGGGGPLVRATTVNGGVAVKRKS